MKFIRNNIKKIIIVTIAFFLLLVMPFVFNRGNSFVSAQKTESELMRRIEELQKKIEQTKKQADSLSREISIINQNIELKEVQIKQAEYEVEQKKKELDALEEDIDLLEVRLDRLDEKIKYHELLLGARMKQRYMDEQKPMIELLFGSEGISGFISKLQYLKRVEEQDKELLDRMAKTKGNYENQQDLLEKKKDKVEELKRDIEAQKAQAEKLKGALEQQEAQKKNLLAVTKNNESKYKQMLKNAKRELEQIQSAANVVIREGNGVKVKRGEKIGTMGNSGYSTGAHLHFGVYKYTEDDFKMNSNWGWYYKNYVDPKKYLKPKEVVWDTGCYRDPKGTKKTGSGKWEWPMKSPRITQNYGSNTCYNWMYRGRPHPALDMVGRGDITIYAVDDGEAYFCRNCLGDGGNGVFIFHDNGKMSLYWHLR